MNSVIYILKVSKNSSIISEISVIPAKQFSLFIIHLSVSNNNGVCIFFFFLGGGGGGGSLLTFHTINIFCSLKSMLITLYVYNS